MTSIVGPTVVVLVMLRDPTRRSTVSITPVEFSGRIDIPNYGPSGNEFSGEVNWVKIDQEKDDLDHLISPDERFRMAMARQ